MAGNNFDPKDIRDILRMLTPAEIASQLDVPRSVFDSPETARSDVEFLVKHLVQVESAGAYKCADLVSALNKYSRHGETTQLPNLVSVLSTHPTAEMGVYPNIEGLKPVGWATAIDAANKEETGPVSGNAACGDNSVPSAMKPTVGVILCQTPMVSPMMRDAALVAMFLNSIPTHIMSMAVPYLHVEFMFDRSGQKRSAFRAPSPLRFLMGGMASLAIDGKSPDSVLANSSIVGPEGAQREVTTMDTFCMPQTLTNFGMKGGGVLSAHYNEVLDPTRPLMSIENLNLNISPMVGFHTYKKGTMVLRVHDRSRLVDVADLIKPGEYNNVTVMIQYGWSFPANVDPGYKGYAEIIRRMMSPVECYGVSNSSISTDAVGQAQINLELYTKAQMFAREYSVIIKDVTDQLRILDEASDFVKEHRESLGLGEPDGTKEIRLHKLLGAASRGSAPDMTAGEIKQAYEELVHALRGNTKLSPDSDRMAIVKKFLDAVKKVTGETGQDSMDSNVRSSAHRYIRNQTAQCAVSDPWIAQKDGDPFWNEVKWYKTALSANKGEGVLFKAKPSDKKDKGYYKEDVSLGVCSLAKLLSVFMLEPFRKMGHEVQLIFYTFNGLAGPAAYQSIGKFPIELGLFCDQFYKTVANKGTDSMTIEEFMGFVFSNFVNDNFALGYGLRRFYEPYDGSDSHNRKDSPPLQPGQSASKTAETYESVMASFSESHGDSWTTPKIEIHMETVAARAADDAPTSDASRGGVPTEKVTRIHIFDKVSSPFMKPQMVMAHSDGGYDFIDAEEYKSLESAVAFVKAQHAAVGNTDGSKENEKSATTAAQSWLMTNQQFKKRAARLFPTLVFGTNTSGITTATLSSKGDALLSTRNMIQQSRNDGPRNTSMSNGAGVGNIPVQVMPMSLAMTTFGCPRLWPTQLFFIDFNTGTSMDNIYLLTTLSHTLAPGKFESSAQFAFYNAYGEYKSPVKALRWIEKQVNQVEKTKK